MAQLSEFEKYVCMYDMMVYIGVGLCAPAHIGPFVISSKERRHHHGRAGRNLNRTRVHARAEVCERGHRGGTRGRVHEHM